MIAGIAYGIGLGSHYSRTRATRACHWTRTQLLDERSTTSSELLAMNFFVLYFVFVFVFVLFGCFLIKQQIIPHFIHIQSTFNQHIRIHIQSFIFIHSPENSESCRSHVLYRLAHQAAATATSRSFSDASRQHSPRRIRCKLLH